jgi:UDP-N-acetylmuramoylalanine--D-glutamate ligase
MLLKKVLSLPHQNKSLAIVGLGKENIQFLEWLIRVANFDPNFIYIADQKAVDSKLDFEAETNRILTSQSMVGDDYLKLLEKEEIEYVVKSPGIWSLRPEFANFRQKKGQDKIISSLAFFFEKFREQIIAVTGTKGKTTTSNLVNHLLKQFQPKVNSTYCGNTSNISPYAFWEEFEQPVDINQYYVVEISSFQLQDLAFSKISPKYSVITNYYVDHLDQHATKEEYWSCKDNIFAFQESTDTTVVTKSVFENTQNSLVLSKKEVISENYIDELSNYFQTKLPGKHNLLNLALAVRIVKEVIPKEEDKENFRKKIQEGLDSFKPVSHRLELIRRESFENLEINFYDDGAASEPEAVIAAIEALSESENSFIWLHLTGKDKGQDVSRLAEVIKEKITGNKLYRVDFCGEIGKRIKNKIEDLEGSSQTLQRLVFKDLITLEYISLHKIEQDFLSLFSKFKNNSENSTKNKPVLNILLSPGSSSFDEFNNYLERAEWWQDKVNQLHS